MTDRLAALDARMRSVIAWCCVAAMLIAAAFYLGPPRLLLFPALVPLLLAVRASATVGSVRGCLLVLAVLIAGLCALWVSFGGVPHVSTASRSPDGTVVADVYEVSGTWDRGFVVRLTTYWLGVIPIRDVVFASGEQAWASRDRLVWSTDGRHVLMLGTHLWTEGGCLASGERLYLLVDARTREIASNASGGRARRFSSDDLAGMNFDIDLTPSVWDKRRRRCVPS